MELNKIETYLDNCLKENGYTDCFLVDMSISDAKKIKIFLDSDSSITFSICRKISRYIEEILDTTLEFGPDYTLEVSSAGIGKPLKFKRQYLKNIGRTVAIKTFEKEKIRGILMAVNDESIVLKKEIIKKQGKKESKTYKEMEIDMKNIREIKIAVSF